MKDRAGFIYTSPVLHHWMTFLFFFFYLCHTLFCFPFIVIKKSYFMQMKLKMQSATTTTNTLSKTPLLYLSIVWNQKSLAILVLNFSSGLSKKEQLIGFMHYPFKASETEGRETERDRERDREIQRERTLYHLKGSLYTWRSTSRIAPLPIEIPIWDLRRVNPDS